MTPDASTMITEHHNPTQHAMLVAWGQFARTLGFTQRLAGLPIDQKVVVRAPHGKLDEFAIGLLSGIEYLSDLSEGPAIFGRTAVLGGARETEGHAIVLGQQAS